eukprot:4314129-Prymnesium_polylepis.1
MRQTDGRPLNPWLQPATPPSSNERAYANVPPRPPPWPCRSSKPKRVNELFRSAGGGDEPRVEEQAERRREGVAEVADEESWRDQRGPAVAHREGARGGGAADVGVARHEEERQLE